MLKYFHIELIHIRTGTVTEQTKTTKYFNLKGAMLTISYLCITYAQVSNGIVLSAVEVFQINAVNEKNSATLFKHERLHAWVFVLYVFRRY